jgi:8-oxo-dGTP pyrophosphatase MutT (NUDIX family)
MKLSGIRKTLSGNSYRKIENKDFSPAAVNLLLLEIEDDLSLVFTRRSTRVEHHKGQISFPGGQWDEEDRDLWRTAARETEEEIGIPAEKMECLGRMDDFLTISDYRVTPFVSFYLGEYPVRYKLQKSELDYVIEVPLSFLTDPSNLGMIPFPYRDSSFAIPHFWYHGNVIWGITAFILFHFLKKMGELSELQFPKETEARELIFGRKLDS